MLSKKENGGCSLLFLMLLAFGFGHSTRQAEVNREREDIWRDRNQINTIRAAAEKGDAEAQFKLGRLYENFFVLRNSIENNAQIKFLLPVRLSARQASRYYARPYTARKRAGRKNVFYADSPQAAGY